MLTHKSAEETEDSSPTENLVMLPEGGVDAGQAKVRDGHCFLKSVNCYHSRETIRKTFRWPASHLTRVLYFDSSLVLFQ